MTNLSYEAINLLRHNARSVVRELGLLNDAYFEIGVTLAERHLLIELASCRSVTAGEIAERLLLDKSTISRLIARAMKKGYIHCTADKVDKRKRFLELSELGKETLEAFEPIAFNQTKQALLTLAPEEIDLVHQGIALYAQGLKNSRLQSPKEESEICITFENHGITLSPFRQEDEKSLYQIFQEVVDSGAQFPYESSSIQEFYHQFFASESQVYVCRSQNQEVIGGFYIKPNYSGRSRHVANAAYMIKSSHRGRGIGTFLVNASLDIAKDLGFQSMMFNMVLSQNKPAINLYQKLGFSIIGTIPEAVRNPDGTYQDGYIFYRKLNNE